MLIIKKAKVSGNGQTYRILAIFRDKWLYLPQCRIFVCGTLHWLSMGWYEDKEHALQWWKSVMAEPYRRKRRTKFNDKVPF